MKPPAIVFTVWAHQQEVLAPYLAAHRGASVITFGDRVSPVLREIARAHGSDVFTLESLLPKDRDPQEAVRTELTALRSGLAAAPETALPAQAAAAIERAAESELPVVASVLDMLNAAADRFDVRLAVVSEDFTWQGKTIASWARSSGVPSLHIAHWEPLGELYTVHSDLIADYVAVPGARGTEPYLDLGIDQSRILITGNPAWDGFVSRRDRKDDDRAIVVEALALDPDLPIVVFATTFAGAITARSEATIFEDTLTAFIRAIAQLRQAGVGVNAVVKDRLRPDPADGSSTLRRMLVDEGMSEDAIVHTSEYGTELANAAQAVVGVDSNYLIGAMLLGTTPINLLTRSGLELGPFFDAHSGVDEVEPHELGPAITRLLDDGERRAALRSEAEAKLEYYNSTDGERTAVDRLAEIMTEMAPGVAAAARRYRRQRLVRAAARRPWRTIPWLARTVRQRYSRR